MSLKLHIAKLEEVEEKYRELYVQTDKGDYQLEVDEIGDVVTAKEKVKEFRDNNIQLKKQLSEMEQKIAKFSEVDVEEYKRLKLEIEKNNRKGGLIDQIDPEKLEALVSEKTKGMLESHKKDMQASNELVERYKKESEQKSQQLVKVTIDSGLRDAITRNAVPAQGAMEDILERGRKVWQINEEGKAVPLDKNGEVIRSKHDARNIMGMDEWAQQLSQTEAPFLFQNSAGGSAPGGKSGTKTGKSDLDYLSKLSKEERLTHFREMKATA